MRLFIAVPFDKETKEYFTGIQNKVKTICEKGNFTLEENFHLTLKFLGEISPEKVNSICKAMEDSVTGIPPFTLYADTLGTFGRGNRRIVWVGLKGERERLDSIYGRLEECLAARGFEKDDKPYTPHITLGREVLYKSGAERSEDRVEIAPKKIEVNKIALMESRREKGRLVYQPLFYARLSWQKESFFC